MTEGPMTTIAEGRPERPRRRRPVVIAAIIVVLAAGGIWTYTRIGGRVRQAGHHTSTTYYCPMHTTYRSDKPGNCPICSMKLVPLEAALPSGSAPGEAAQSAPMGTAQPSPPVAAPNPASGS